MVKVKKIFVVSFFVLSILCLLMAGSNTASGADSNTGLQAESGTMNEWKQVPLRTKEQRDAGLAGGEGMQMIWGLSYAPSNPEILYLVSDTSQVWKSIDGGNSWQMKHRGFLSNGGVSLVIGPNNENVVFAAGSVHDSPDASDEFADGIYRTRDGGENWKLVRRTPFYRMEDKKGGVNFAFAKTNTVYGLDR